MPLRHIVTLLTTLLVVAAVASSGSLIAVTGFLHEQTSSIENNLESVRSVEEIELELLWHARNSHLAGLTGDPQYLEAARQGSDDAHVWYQRAHRHAGNAAEQSAFEKLSASLDDYFSAYESFARSTLSPGEVYLQASPALGRAYADAEEVLRMNLEQAALAAQRARDWNAVANWLGTCIAMLLLGSVAIVIAGSRAQVYRPLLALREAITRFGGRERSARAAETGALEIRQIARSFNEMADALERHRTSQLSFVAGIAHDLRNPLGVMKTALSTLPNDLSRPSEHLGKNRGRHLSTSRLVGENDLRLPRDLPHRSRAAQASEGEMRRNARSWSTPSTCFARHRRSTSCWSTFPTDRSTLCGIHCAWSRWPTISSATR